VNEANALLIGLLQDGNRAAALAKLRKYNGELVEVGDASGAEPWEVLADVLRDCRPLGADTCYVFTNAELSTRMAGPAGAVWVEKWGKWKLDTAAVEEWNRTNAVKFAVLRELFRYSWRWARVGPEKLQSTRGLLSESQ
jgi:hypothetical protein